MKKARKIFALALSFVMLMSMCTVQVAFAAEPPEGYHADFFEVYPAMNGETPVNGYVVNDIDGDGVMEYGYPEEPTTGDTFIQDITESSAHIFKIKDEESRITTELLDENNDGKKETITFKGNTTFGSSGTDMQLSYLEHIKLVQGVDKLRDEGGILRITFDMKLGTAGSRALLLGLPPTVNRENPITWGIFNANGWVYKSTNETKLNAEVNGVAYGCDEKIHLNNDKGMPVTEWTTYTIEVDFDKVEYRFTATQGEISFSWNTGMFDLSALDMADNNGDNTTAYMRSGDYIGIGLEPYGSTSGQELALRNIGIQRFKKDSELSVIRKFSVSENAAGLKIDNTSDEEKSGKVYIASYKDGELIGLTVSETVTVPAGQYRTVNNLAVNAEATSCKAMYLDGTTPLAKAKEVSLS